MHGGFLISFHKGRLFSYFFLLCHQWAFTAFATALSQSVLEAMNVPFGGMLSEPDCHDDMLPFRHRRFANIGICLYACFSFCFQLSWYTGASGYQGSALSPDEPDCGWVFSGHDTRIRPNLVHSSF
jgi:hypothetical protein